MMTKKDEDDQRPRLICCIAEDDLIPFTLPLDELRPAATTVSRPSIGAGILACLELVCSSPSSYFQSSGTEVWPIVSQYPSEGSLEG